MDRIEELQRRHTAEVIAIVQSITDPAERIKKIVDVIDRSHEQSAELGVIRRDAVRELCSTMRRVEVAEKLGVTVQRVGQLLND